MTEKKLIFVVDDDTDLTAEIRFALEEHGFGVVVAVNGEEAFRQLEKIKPALIILDLKMPRVGGLLLCRYIHATAHLPDVPVLAISGDIEQLEAIAKYPVEGILPKPFPIETLTQEVCRILAKKRSTGCADQFRIAG